MPKINEQSQSPRLIQTPVGLITLKELWRRYLLLFVAFFTIALGVALSSRARLGVSPVSSIPFVLSQGLGLSAGSFTILLHSFFLFLQFILLGKAFELMRLTQLISFFAFGFFVDFTLWLLSWLVVENYLLRWLLAILSFFIIAFGVFLEVKAGVSMLAAEGLTTTIAKVFHFDFGKVKFSFDVILVSIAFIASLLLYGELRGVGEGTIVSALAIGWIVRYYFKIEKRWKEKAPLAAKSETAAE